MAQNGENIFVDLYDEIVRTAIYFIFARCLLAEIRRNKWNLLDNGISVLEFDNFVSCQSEEYNSFGTCVYIRG